MAWPVSYEAGRMNFNAGGVALTIPNPAMAVIEFGFTQLQSWALTGDNREVSSGHVAYPGVIKQQRADIPLLIAGGWNPAGTPYASSIRGLNENIALINRLALVTVDDTTDGTQNVTYIPYPGATPIVGRVQVLPIQMSTSAKHGGSAVALQLILPDGPIIPLT